MRTKRPATVSSKATQVLHPQVGERAGERTLTGLAPDGTAGHSGIAFHAAPTQLLPIITLDERDVTDSAHLGRQEFARCGRTWRTPCR